MKQLIGTAAIAVLGLLGVASADRPGSTGPAVCAPDHDLANLTIVDGAPVACWRSSGAPEVCIAMSRPGMPSIAKPPPTPPPARPGPQVREVAGTLSACHGQRCVRLGKLVVAAIADHARARAAERERPGAATDDVAFEAPELTADLQLLTVGKELLEVRKDRRIEISPPAEYRRTGDEGDAFFAGFTLIENVAIADWSTCAGPCGKAVRLRRDGSNAGAWFEGGIPFVLGGKRLLVVSDQTTLIDLAGKARRQTLRLKDRPLGMLRAAQLDRHTVIALWDAPGSWQFSWLELPAGKPGKITTRRLAVCPSSP